MPQLSFKCHTIKTAQAHPTMQNCFQRNQNLMTYPSFTNLHNSFTPPKPKSHDPLYLKSNKTQPHDPSQLYIDADKTYLSIYITHTLIIKNAI